MANQEYYGGGPQQGGYYPQQPQPAYGGPPPMQQYPPQGGYPQQGYPQQYPQQGMTPVQQKQQAAKDTVAVAHAALVSSECAHAAVSRMSFVSIAVPIVSSKFVARNARFYLEKSGGSGDCSVVPRTNASRTGVRHGVFRITPTLVSFAMEDADEYERERQEQIRQNKALLESLGLNSNTTRIRSPSPPRLKKPVAKPRSRTQSQDEDDSTTTRSRRTPRTSSRLASSSGGRVTYNESDLIRGRTRKLRAADAAASKKPEPRQGSRKSRRIASGGTAGRGAYDVDSDEDDSARGSYHTLRPQLKKLKNPAAPEEPDSDSDRSDRVEGEVDDENGYWISGVRIERKEMPLPTRETLPRGMGGKGDLIFEDKWSHFRPNLTPEEVLRGGAFGGGFYRDHYSTVLHRHLDSAEDIAELPPSWITNLDHATYLSNPEYEPALNRFGRKAGQSLSDWEKAGWIAKVDPRGWFQWYVRFYNGRRCSDDARQVGRWLRACGPAGRFKRSVATQVARHYGVDRAKNAIGWDDVDVSPVIRQVCWQWAYELNQRDYLAYLP